MKINSIASLWIVMIVCGLMEEASSQVSDPRNIRNGYEIPTETYADQPYVVRTDDDAWLVCLTTGVKREGEPGQHIVTMRSTDHGKNWSAPVAVEPAAGPEASYAVMLKVPSGRIYIFYNHNTDNIRKVKADDPPYTGGWCYRVDSQGYYVFKYSDDHGRSWSEARYPIPVRLFDIDRKNSYGGEIRFFWNVGKPFVREGAAYVPLIKVGGFGRGFFTSNEGVLLRSNNILEEDDPRKIRWETLPDGDQGLRTPPGGGPIAAEQSYSVLSDGSIYAVYRSIDGHPVATYSRDGGYHWEPPRYKKYADGRLMKHPRAANFTWKCSNGKYLYWFHNHGGRFIRENPGIAYNDRNPAWLCGGIEEATPDGVIIKWSQPEMVLYDDDPFVRMSYPDLIEEGGRYFITETQKSVARVHEIDTSLINGLWRQFEEGKVTSKGLVLELGGRNKNRIPKEVPMPELGEWVIADRQRADHGLKQLNTGFTAELWFRINAMESDQQLLDNRTRDGRGFCLRTIGEGTVEIIVNDGRTENRWACDRGMLSAGAVHHLVVAIDAGPDIVTYVVDGELCDGGDERQFGWGRISPHLRSANGSERLRVGPNMQGAILSLRIYDQPLKTSEAIANFNAGL